uniref:Uncharacterized mitochondrial protein AtMg00810-like n=1 Tax=Tanacetum cinerariifolium TaxID=118510 RepID=A0A6L2L487_TANCI|nr:uncharacterized mitochondrial protein AtMg00810-like [Tanacetum cinerariifolium]
MRLKDEAPDAIIKCIKNIQGRLNAIVLNVRTDNGTEFVNQTLREFYKNVSISCQTSVARTPQQKGIVKSRNKALVEDARTICTYIKFPSIQEQEQSPIISQGVEESPKIPNFNNDPIYETLHEDSTSHGSSSNVRPSHIPFELLDVDDGENDFLSGLQISQCPRGIFINQSNYALEIIKKYRMLSSDPVYTHLVDKSNLDKDLQGKPVDPTHYRGMIHSIMYLTSSIPDLVFAVCMCARYQAKPTEKHLHVVKRIFQYLKGIIAISLWYSKDSFITLTAYADADHTEPNINLQTSSQKLCHEKDSNFLVEKLGYPAFLIRAEVSEIYMHQFWHTVTKIKNSSSYKFKLDKKQFIIDVEVFRDILQICPRLPNQEFDALPSDEEIVTFIKELGGGMNMALSFIQLKYGGNQVKLSDPKQALRGRHPMLILVVVINKCVVVWRLALPFLVFFGFVCPGIPGF